MPVRRVLTVYAAVMTTLIGLFYAVPAVRLPVTVVIGLTSVVAVVTGALAHRPHRRYSWWLIAGGLLALAVGDAAYLAALRVPADPSGSAAAGTADVFYLLVFPLFGGGMLGLTRSTVRARDRAGLLDSTIFGTAVLFLLWMLFIQPYLIAPGPPTFERSALAAYALGGAILLVVTARILVTAGRNPAAVLLVVGAGGLFIADAVYGAAVLRGTWRSGGLVEMGWFACYATWGAAALHPSMTALTEPAEPRRAEVSRLRLVLLGLAALLAPAVLLWRASTGTVREGVVIAAVSGITFMLVLSRLSDAVDAHRLAVARERTLRTAGAALVSATDVAAVERAVRVAVQQLLPRQTAHRIVFAVHRAGGVPAAATSIWGPGLAASSTFYAGPTAAAARRTRLLRVRTLRPPLDSQLRGFTDALLCPLVLDERPAGVPRVGALLVAADVEVLSRTRDPLEMLAAQVALALERVSLSEEISRRDSDEYFRSLVQHTADVILVVNDDYRIRYASPSVATVLGIPPGDCDDLRSVVHPDDRETFAALLGAAREAAALADRPRGEWSEWRVRRTDGGSVDLEVSCRDLRQDRAVRGFVLTLRDVTERRRLERELGHRAAHDPLTGLTNRASFQDQVHAAVEAARDGGRTVGALSIDLDEFTAINDTYGQAVGDEVLVAVAGRLCVLVAGAGLVARLGGDEFAVLLPDADDPDQVEQVAEQLVTALAEPLVVAGTPIAGSVSIGVATSVDATDAGELLQRADLALYVAKGAGKRRWSRYQSELHSAIVERLELRAALAEAVDRMSFTLEYQPIVDMCHGAVVGFEALARWRHPARGLIPPEQFIAIAEETGLIEPIGDWVLREAVGAAGAWYRRGGSGPTPYVSVNVSARQLRSTGFVKKVRAALDVADLPPTAVMLEITESLLLRDEEPVWSELTELRGLGLRVAIDDFGTGFSSLSYLQRMPADVLKIDRSFTETVAASRRQRLLVEGIIRLAGTLGLEVISEGVETEEVRLLLTDIGCVAGQGYLFSRPLTASDVADWVATGRRIDLPPRRAE